MPSIGRPVLRSPKGRRRRLTGDHLTLRMQECVLEGYKKKETGHLSGFPVLMMDRSYGTTAR